MAHKRCVECFLPLNNPNYHMAYTVRRLTRCFSSDVCELTLQAENERLRKLAANLRQRVAELRNKEKHRPPIIFRMGKITPRYH